MNARMYVLVIAVMTAVVAGVYVYAFKPITLPPPAEAEPVARTDTADFVGSASCASCHATQFAAWQRSTHGRAGGPPAPDLVLAPFSGATIRFANASVTPRSRAGVYEFVVERPREAPETLRVAGVVGGGHIYGGGTQGFVTRRVDGTWRLIPFEWSRHDRVWFCNTNSRSGRGWAPITPAMRLEECGDWPPTRVLGDVARFGNCQSCHASQATVALDSASGRYETRLTSLAINCESCHGPGRQHLTLARNLQLGGRTDTVSGFATLATLDKDASVRLCYQCHSVKDQLRDGYRSGDALEAYYSLKLPLLGDAPLFPDGRIRTFAYQEGHSYSDCYLNGGMTCVSCHDPHDQSYRTVTGVALAGRFNDAQCTSCHVSKAEQPRAHTKHPASVACTACHMPARQQQDTRAAGRAFAGARVIRYERADHTISIPRPALDSAYGIASACAACHAGLSTAQHVTRVRALWGDTKPPAAPTHPYARFSAASRILEGVTPDLAVAPAQRATLDSLAASQDVDTRAVALAALHLSAGTSRSARRRLADALRAGTGEASLRARWAVALGYMGDHYAANRQYGNAIVAFSRAAEVWPSRARLYLSLANAQRDDGDLASALASYRRSLAIDRRSPIAWVNYGLALGAAGDTAGALDAFSSASALDPFEPLAWYNTANILYVRRDFERSAAMYENAVALDPGMALGHFQLARLHLFRRDEPRALASLMRGLAFDSSDATAKQMARTLTDRLGGPR